jgi:type IV fimbrial biogenesis protein FimT
MTTFASFTSRRGLRGFTLIELMVTVSILAILLGIAAPSFRDTLLNVRMTALANDLMSDLANARSEAAKRGVRVALCTSNNGSTCTNTAWQNGWIVFADGVNTNGLVDTGESVLKVVRAAATSASITATGVSTATGGGAYIQYRPSGTNGVTAGNIVLTLCDTRTTAAVGAAAASNKGRQITIGTTGRAAVTRYTCA